VDPTSSRARDPRRSRSMGRAQGTGAQESLRLTKAADLGHRTDVALEINRDMGIVERRGIDVGLAYSSGSPPRMVAVSPAVSGSSARISAISARPASDSEMLFGLLLASKIRRSIPPVKANDRPAAPSRDALFGRAR
jgi:hypothetical protein